MKTVENIPVFIDTKDGKTICICHRSDKRCNKDCTEDVVSRDKFRGWQETFARDIYGR